MKKAILCYTITGSPQREPGQVAPMQNFALLKFNTEESFLLLDTTFKIISFNLSIQKLWINFAKNICEGDRLLTKVPAHRLTIPENILLKAVLGSDAEEEIEFPFPDPKSCKLFSHETGSSGYVYGRRKNYRKFLDKYCPVAYKNLK
jgi:hypothetical protein